MTSAAPRRRSIVGTSFKVGIAAVIAILAVGCSTNSSSNHSDGKSSTLTVDLQAYPSTLDPGLQYDPDSYSVYRNVYDQLVHRDPKTSKVIPWLATSWKTIDPTTWQFTMRKDVKFTNGDPLTAADAAFSINRILDPKTASQQNANFSAIGSATGSGQTLTIKTKYPSATVLSYLTSLSVVSEKYVKQVGSATLNSKPMGSGPYEFVSAVSGSQVVLKRNPSYWGREPSIAHVVFRAAPNLATRVADLQAGKAQIANGMTPDSAKQLQSAPNLQVLSTPSERVSYIAFNTIHGGPTNNATVRKAISLSINYQSLIKNLQGDYAKPVNSVLTPLNLGYDTSLPVFAYNPGQAKSLIQQAGFAGKTITMAASPTYDPNIIQAIQGNLESVGLKVKIVNTDQATYLQKVQSPTHDWGSIRFGQWSCSCLDADGTIYPLFHSGTIWSSYSNSQYDKLVDQARQTLDTTQRKRLYTEALGILHNETPGIGLYQMDVIYVANKSLNFTPDAQEDFFIANMSFGS